MAPTTADLSPLLKVLLEAKLTPPVDANAVMEQLGALLTPLYYAIHSGHVSCVRLLVEHGVSLKQPCGLREGAFDWPVRACTGDIGDCASAGEDTVGGMQVLDYLLGAGADVDARDTRRFEGHEPENTPLFRIIDTAAHVARASRAAFDAIEPAILRLIEAGAEVNPRDSAETIVDGNVRGASNRRVLDAAAPLPSMAVFKALVAKGAEPSPTAYIGTLDTGHQRGTHYLHVAVQHGRADVIRAAAAAGVDFTKLQTMSGDPVPLLALAAGRGKVDCVGALLDAGVDVNEIFQISGDKVTALDVFGCLAPGEHGSRLQIAMMLLAAGGRPYRDLKR